MQLTQKTPAHRRRFYASPRILCILGFVLAYLVSLTTLAPQASAAALSAPGGNVSDPVVRQVDIARPAVVRIITTIDGRLSVRFSSAVSATFPQGGGSYSLMLAGTGSFISAHGDILTADHVVNPPKDQGLDQDLYQHAAQDVADFINSHFQVTTPYSASDAYAILAGGALPSTSSYDQPTSEAYLSTSYVGAINAAKLETVPASSKAPVDRIEAQSDFTQNDVAIIHVSGMDNMPSIQLDNSATVNEQDNLTLIGYPGLADLSKNPTNLLTSSINKIYVSALKTTDSGAPVIQVGGNVEHGDSGGPALDNSGHIVGIVSFGYSGVNGDYGQTSFLQASSSALTLIKQLGINTTPGAFETAWTQAINDYSASDSGHWQKAETELQSISQAYPNFLGVSAYLNYAKNQAGLEQNTSSSGGSSALLIVLIIVILLAILGIILFWVFRRNTRPVVVAPAAAQYPASMYQQQSGIYGPVPTGYNATGPQSLPGAVPFGQQPQPVPSGVVYPNYAAPATYGTPLPNQVPQTPPFAPGIVPQTPQPTPAPWQNAAFPPVQTPRPVVEEVTPQASAPVDAPAEPKPEQNVEALPDVLEKSATYALPAEQAAAMSAWTLAVPPSQTRLPASTSWPTISVGETGASEEEKTVLAQSQSRGFSVPRRPAVAEAVVPEAARAPESLEATVASPFTWVAPCGHTNAPDVRFCRVCGQPVAPSVSSVPEVSESNGA
ncbi:MAG TPA: trypsin-like peptidase domain-containing protein [Ktedonobacteraceae bacterium]